MKKSFILVMMFMLIALMFMGCNNQEDVGTTEVQSETETEVQTESENSTFDEAAAEEIGRASCRETV